MAEREELLAALQGRLRHAQNAQDLSKVLEPAALTEAGRLIQVLDDQDIEGRYLLGWLHWYRYQALPEGHDQEDLNAALEMFLFCFVYDISDEALPEQLLPDLAYNAIPDAVEWLRQIVVGSPGPTAINATVRLWQHILTNIPSGHPNRAMTLNNLAIALNTRFAWSGLMADLNAAIDASREVVQATPTDHPDRPGRLNNLGDALRVRFERSGEVADLEAAVNASQGAVQAAPADDPNRPMYLSDLGVALGIRFERFGAIADLDAAVSAGREAVQATPTDAPQRPRRLNNLGGALRVRFEWSGEVADLDAAIDAVHEAVQATPPHHPDRGLYLGNLGIALAIRFERFGAVADLDAAVSAGREAVQATPTDDHDRPRRLHNLGGTLRTRFERSNTVADLDAAIDAAREAVQAAPTDYPDRALFLGSLGAALATRFAWSGAVADLDSAIDAGREAAQATPTAYPDHAKILSNLGVGLWLRFARSDAIADLDAAINAARESVEAAPTDHPARAEHLGNLGTMLRTRFERSGAVADLDAAVSAQVAAARMGSAAPSVRVRAGRAAGDLLAASDPARAARLLEDAVRLLPEVAPRGLEQSDQQELLGGLAGLAGDAAALTLADPSVPPPDRAGRALGLLELGRAILLAQVLATRGDLTDLRTQDPDLARRFTQLRNLLDQSLSDSTWFGTDAGLNPDLVREAQDRRRVAADFGALLEQIRSLEGFASFALPPTLEDLRGQAMQGPVVTFNISGYRSDALLLTEQGITSVALPDLTPAVVIDRINVFHQALADSADPDPDADRGAAQQRVRDILAWLWDTAVGPVLDTLGYTESPVGEQDWPRVWWTPGGLLSLLPLHAAGHHTASHDPGHKTMTVLDRVISSYTPTIGALRHARQHATLPPSQSQTLIVAMPFTPGLEQQPRLSAVLRESALLQTRLPQPILLAEPEPGTSEPGNQFGSPREVWRPLCLRTVR